MASGGALVLVAVSSVMMAVLTAGQQEGVEVEVLLGHLVEEHLSGCHLVLITTTQYSPVFSRILRRMSEGVQAGVVVETGLLSRNHEPATQKDPAQEQPDEGNRQTHDQSAEDLLLKGLWGDARTICRAVILDLTVTNHTQRTLSLLEASRLWMSPETYVLVVGWKAKVETILLHPCFRNTLHALYLALDHLTDLHTPGLQGSNNPLLRKDVVQEGVESEGLELFRRCEYCHSGEDGVELLSHWNLTSGLPDTHDLFQDQLENFMGHQFRIVGMLFFPYLDYQRDTQEPGTTVTPKDSLGVRVLNTLASVLNFTYEIHEQRDRAWGLQQPNGSFNGVVGDLESEEADFCILMAPTPTRLQVMEFSGAYPSDVLSITSLKPTLLPQHLALIRPFAGELWVILLVSVVLWGGTLWLLHGAWRRLAGGPGLGIIPAVLFGWGVLLETPPPGPALRLSGRVLVGWWLVFCLVICTAFRSSLVAHLTVQGRTRPIETFQDLVEQDSWGWATEPWVMTGLPLEYFSSHTDPVVKTIYEKMEVLQVDEALQKVLAGGYSFIIFKNYISVIVATRYTDAQGHTLLYTSDGGVAMTSSFGWGFRRGAPFRSRFSHMMWHLRDAGIIDQWKTEVMSSRVRQKRREAAALNNNQTGHSATSQGESDSQVALGLHHLQGAFYLLLFGQGLALLTFLGEHLVHSRCPPRKPHLEENFTPLRILPQLPHPQQRNLIRYRMSYY